MMQKLQFLFTVPISSMQKGAEHFFVDYRSILRL